MLIDNIDLLCGVLMGAVWTSFLFAVFISRHMP